MEGEGTVAVQTSQGKIKLIQNVLFAVVWHITCLVSDNCRIVDSLSCLMMESVLLREKNRSGFSQYLYDSK